MIKLSKTDIRLLQSIFRGNNAMREIALDIRISTPRISTASSRLEQLGFLSREKHGVGIKLKYSNQPFIQNLKQLLSRNLQFDKILTGSAIPFLMTLIIPEMAPRSKSEEPAGLNMQQIQRFSGLSAATAFRVRSNLIISGAIFLQNNLYRISGSMVELKDFLRYLSQFSTASVIRNLAKEFGISESKLIPVFTAGGEIILSAVDTPAIPSGHGLVPTALTAFRREGLQFLTTTDYHHFSAGGRKLQREDFIIDNLLLGTGNPQNILYTMLYLQYHRHKIDRDYLMEIGAIFGIRDILTDIVHYLQCFPDTEGESFRWFPKVREFRELCTLYGVDIDG